MIKQRLDILLVERGLAESRSLAQRLVMAGQVRVNGQVVLKASAQVAPGSELMVEHGPRYVSRGGEKLQAALQAFGAPVIGRTCADVGASTGGFTDCLLQNGARKVYAIDVGQGILDWSLRQNPQVVVMEGENARFVERLPEPVDLVTIDASFISLKLLLPVVIKWFAGIPPGLSERGGKGEVLALIKPQFEAGRSEVKRGQGVIRDPLVHRQVLLDVLGFAHGMGLGLFGLIRSPLLGPKGNIEFLAWLRLGEISCLDLETVVDVVLLASAVDLTFTEKDKVDL
jgi:23S rRNA (cytidine1920-2'-O)/16S rRNA (cytidine1409-2'-O)-methyltransferase